MCALYPRRDTSHAAATPFRGLREQFATALTATSQLLPRI